MQPNPYESSKEHEPPRELLPRTGSIGTSLIRIGGSLAATGIALFVITWIVFYQLYDGEPQFGIQISVLVALAMVPIGVVIGSVGIVLWFIKVLKS